MKFALIQILFCCVFSFSFSAPHIFAQERTVLPVDEASKDQSFVRFRARLIKAVKNRDQKFVLSILAKDIKNSFGGFGGIDGFKKLWKPNSPDTKLWKELLAVLSNGGTFSSDDRIRNKQFFAPYLFTIFPEDLDAFEHQIIFGKNVNLRAKPNLSSKILAKLSYNVVKVDFENSVSTTTDDSEFIWLKVKTLGGQVGFVAADYVRSPIDYRACFEKVNGRWKMIFFLAGD